MLLPRLIVPQPVQSLQACPRLRRPSLARQLPCSRRSHAPSPLYGPLQQAALLQSRLGLMCQASSLQPHHVLAHQAQLQAALLRHRHCPSSSLLPCQQRHVLTSRVPGLQSRQQHRALVRQAKAHPHQGPSLLPPRLLLRARLAPGRPAAQPGTAALVAPQEVARMAT